MNGPSERLRAGDAQPSHLPTVLTLADGYRVYDPAVLADPTHHVDVSDGKVTTTRIAWHGMLAVLLALASGAGAALLLGNGAIWSFALWAVLGSGVGFVVAAVVLDTCTTDPERDYRKAHGRPPYVGVRRDDDLAHRLCELADEIAATRTWRDGLVDPDRTLGTTVWAASRRAVGIGRLAEQLREEMERGAPEPTLSGLRDEIATTTTELEQVRADLTEVATTARALDAKIRPAAAGAPALPGERPVEAELAESLATHARALRDLL